MKRLYNAAASARSALFCQSRTSHSARNMDPVVRDALAETVQHDAASVAAQLREIDQELLQAAATLREFERQEQFLGVRTRQYRKALDAQARELKQQQQQQAEAAAAANRENNNSQDDDEEQQDAASDSYERRLEKWEKDTEALEKIVVTHTQILAQCEQMRRNMRQLEVRQQAISRMSDQCQDFLAAAGRPNSTEDNGVEVVGNATTTAGSGGVEECPREDNNIATPAVVVAASEEEEEGPKEDLYNENNPKKEEDAAIVAAAAAEEVENRNEAAVHEAPSPPQDPTDTAVEQHESFEEEVEEDTPVQPPDGSTAPTLENDGEVGDGRDKA